MFYPLNVTFLTRNCCWKTSFTSSSMKEFCQKMKVKLIFEASIQAVRNRDCCVFGNH